MRFMVCMLRGIKASTVCFNSRSILLNGVDNSYIRFNKVVFSPRLQPRSLLWISAHGHTQQC